VCGVCGGEGRDPYTAPIVIQMIQQLELPQLEIYAQYKGDKEDKEDKEDKLRLKVKSELTPVRLYCE
jgi:hypothetical protein